MISLEPDSFEAWYNLGVSTSQQGRFDESVAAYEKALALDPKNALYAAALNNLGTVQLDRGKKDLAIARWEEAVKASPTQLEARYNLASQYLEQGRLDDAIPLLEEAARLAPNHELVHVRLGRAYMQKGRGEDAYRALTLVRRLYPENWYAPLGMAALHAANGRPDEARKLLDEALRLGGDNARAEAAGYPALAPLLAARAGALRSKVDGIDADPTRLLKTPATATQRLRVEALALRAKPARAEGAEQQQHRTQHGDRRGRHRRHGGGTK